MSKEAEYTIEKNIPMPPLGKRLKYPFDQMDVGDSIVVTDRIAVNAARNWGVVHGRKFSSRTLSDGRVRIWRTK